MTQFCMQNEARNNQGNKIIRSNTAANNFFIKQGQGLKASALGTSTRTFRECPPPPPVPRTSTSKLNELAPGPVLNQCSRTGMSVGS